MNRVNGLNSIAGTESKPLTMAEIAEDAPVKTEGEIEPDEIILDVECVDCNGVARS